MLLETKHKISSLHLFLKCTVFLRDEVIAQLFMVLVTLAESSDDCSQLSGTPVPRYPSPSFGLCHSSQAHGTHTYKLQNIFIHKKDL